jgi:beta-xylosidase
MATHKKVIFVLAIFVLQLMNLSNSFGQVSRNLTYTNPILHEDFSDPDVIRVGNHFYMTASSFISVPGLPILQSEDLVHWNLIGYALQNNVPADYYKKVIHGAGVWAPSIRYHNGTFYIYYPDPDFGIYMIQSKTITGNWSEPILVLAGKGLIDPCPLWDEDGKVYLVHAYAGSRAGIKSVLAMKELNPAGTKVINEGKLIYDGHGIDPTVEGPKLYKRNGWYYVFAPAGGVATGWQIALRSKNIYGPYERKKVMEQGTSTTNGPHQGAWVQTNTGEDWFIHFQDKGAYGRITHLQPMVWKNDWPVIGVDKDGDGIGEPVNTYAVPKISAGANLKNSINVNKLAANPFQWNATPLPNWRMEYAHSFRHYAVVQNDSANNLWNFPAMYLQKLPEEKFIATTKITFNSLQNQERAGFILFGKSYATIELRNTEKGLVLNYVECNKADKGGKEIVAPIITLPASLTNSAAPNNYLSSVYLRIQMDADAKANFAFSLDGVNFTSIPNTFIAMPGIWVGAKIGYYCASNHNTNDAGYLEINSFNIQSTTIQK